jgi:hypothetical protein
LAFLKCSKASFISSVLAIKRPFGIFLSGHIPLSYMNNSLFSLRLVCIFMSLPMKPILLFITSTLNCPPGTGFYKQSLINKYERSNLQVRFHLPYRDLSSRCRESWPPLAKY